MGSQNDTWRHHSVSTWTNKKQNGDGASEKTSHCALIGWTGLNELIFPEAPPPFSFLLALALTEWWRHRRNEIASHQGQNWFSAKKGVFQEFLQMRSVCIVVLSNEPINQSRYQKLELVFPPSIPLLIEVNIKSIWLQLWLMVKPDFYTIIVLIRRIWK